MATMTNSELRVATMAQKITESMDRAVTEVFEELRRAESKFPGFPTDPLHALAVVGEEFGELTQAVLQEVYEPGKQGREAVRKEAVQTAAMAFRFLFHLENFKYVPGEQVARDDEPNA